MSKDVKFLETQKIVIYSELATGMMQQCDELGMQATKAVQIGSITEKEKTEIHNALLIQMQTIEDKRIELVKELDKRMKTDLGLSKGPSTISKYLYDMRAKYPFIDYSEADWKFYQSEQEKKKVAEEVVKPKGKTRELNAKT